MDFKKQLPFIIGGFALASLLSGASYLAMTKLTVGVPKSDMITQMEAQTNAHAPQHAISLPLPRLPKRIQDDSVHYQAENISGAFLSSLFAQRKSRWSDAALYMDELQGFHGANPEVLKKSIVLEMGANNPQAAIKAARAYMAMEVEGDDDLNSRAFASLFVIIGDIMDGNYKDARAQVKAMPQDGLTSFLKPILQSWIAAKDGKFDMDLLRAGHTIHILNAAYIADYLDDKKKLLDILSELSRFSDLNFANTERIGDMYWRAGEAGKAQRFYKTLFKIDPNLTRLSDKTKLSAFDPALAIYQRPHDVQSGIALSMLDMATLLHKDKAYDSARIFANIALYLNPDLHNAVLLKAKISTELEDYQSALALHEALPDEFSALHKTNYARADLYDRAGQKEDAIALLSYMYDRSGDMQALIEIGDIHRRHNDFDQALELYNQVISKHLNGEIPKHLWHLHYARGMVLEQLGHWPQAKADLEAALTFYPDHPFVLNYLGYAMIDRGEELPRALDMIEKALSMQPHDGYITDSLGWALYKMERYDEAASYLERAVELLPADPVINDHLGDAYWQVDRRLEARYQWKRARLHVLKDGTALTDENSLLADLNEKLQRGLKPIALADAFEDAPMQTHVKVELLETQ